MITLSAPAKINLYLHVMGKRSDGYHLLDSLVVFLPDMCDTLSIEKTGRLSFDIAGLVPKGADGADNLVVKAAWALAQFAGRSPDVRIHLEKSIPSGAGLGGGSADAAATIRILEQIWGLSLTPQERETILLSLGADVPVCYHAKPCRFEGIGETISDIPALPRFSILLVWPDAHTSTKEVFAKRPAKFRNARIAIPPVFDGVHGLVSFLEQTGNDLQEAAETVTPAIRSAREFTAAQSGCLLARMTGSGSCVFGIFEDNALCAEAQAKIHAKFPAWWTHTGVV